MVIESLAVWRRNPAGIEATMSAGEHTLGTTAANGVERSSKGTTTRLVREECWIAERSAR
jgi:hypothetical protein